MSRYASGGDDALNTSIKAGLKFWSDRYETTRQRYSESGGLFGKQDFKIAETMYKAFIEAGNEAIDRVKQLKQEQADAAKQAEADAKASAAAAAKARSEAAAKAQQADEKAAAAQIKNAQQAADEVLRMIQQMRDKTRENEPADPQRELRQGYFGDPKPPRGDLRVGEDGRSATGAGVGHGTRSTE